MSKSHITYERLRELLDYEPATGLFTWKANRGGKAKIGSVAGNVITSGYIQITIDRKMYVAHRLAFLYMKGEWPRKEQVDHINRIKTDNRWCNLREASRLENLMNTGIRCTNTSGRKGVSWSKSKSKWMVQIQHDKIKYSLCGFENLEEAAAMFDGAARLLRGEFHNEGAAK